MESIAEKMRVVTNTARPRLETVLRSAARVTPLELFFDLVFVLAFTQCTALMADVPTWEGLAQAMLILGVLWWSWVGYAWLTSVVDPELGSVRIAMFVAMAALLVTALCVEDAFDRLGLLFAGAYGVVRGMQIVLFVIASRDDPNLRRSVTGLALSTAIGIGLLVAASQADDQLQGALWALALLLDMGGPLVIPTEGWRLMPEHFAERHGLIIIIALGESIVAIGAGASIHVDFGVVVAAVLGVLLTAALWALYFDVVALVAARRLENAKPGREQNEVARDSFSYLHFPMVAGIILGALGLKKTLGDVEKSLEIVPATALLGGIAIYLLAHVAFRWRNVHRFNWARLVTSAVFLCLIPLAVDIAAIATLAIALAALAALTAYESVQYRELRTRLRNRLMGEASSA